MRTLQVVIQLAGHAGAARGRPGHLPGSLAAEYGRGPPEDSDPGVRWQLFT
jgi:hypothetical protein